MTLDSGLDTESQDRGMEPVALSEAERPIIQELQRLLAEQSDRQGGLSLVAADGRAVSLPPSVERVLRQLINGLVRGEALTLVPEPAYKRRRDSERRRGLAELSRMTQEYGGYPELEELP